jgi:hypothetical protein
VSENEVGMVLAQEGDESQLNGAVFETIAKQQALLRFFHGDVWLSNEETDILSTIISSGTKAAWLKVWKAFESSRREGGVKKWESTPLGLVLGQGGSSSRNSLDEDSDEGDATQTLNLRTMQTRQLVGAEDYVAAALGESAPG